MPEVWPVSLHGRIADLRAGISFSAIRICVASWPCRKRGRQRVALQLGDKKATQSAAILIAGRTPILTLLLLPGLLHQMRCRLGAIPVLKKSARCGQALWKACRINLLALAMAQAHLAQCRHSLCNPIAKSNSNVQTRPQQHRCFYLAVICELANGAQCYATILLDQEIYTSKFRQETSRWRRRENRKSAPISHRWLAKKLQGICAATTRFQQSSLTILTALYARIIRRQHAIGLAIDWLPSCVSMVVLAIRRFVGLPLIPTSKRHRNPCGQYRTLSNDTCKRRREIYRTPGRIHLRPENERHSTALFGGHVVVQECGPSLPQYLYERLAAMVVGSP